MSLSTLVSIDGQRFEVASRAFDDANLPTSLVSIQANTLDAPCSLALTPRMIEFAVSDSTYRVPVPFALGSAALVAVHQELDTAGTAYCQIGEKPTDSYLFAALS